jgi:hypothetical protein
MSDMRESEGMNEETAEMQSIRRYHRRIEQAIDHSFDFTGSWLWFLGIPIVLIALGIWSSDSREINLISGALLFGGLIAVFVVHAQVKSLRSMSTTAANDILSEIALRNGSSSVSRTWRQHFGCPPPYPPQTPSRKRSMS